LAIGIRLGKIKFWLNYFTKSVTINFILKWERRLKECIGWLNRRSNELRWWKDIYENSEYPSWIIPKVNSRLLKISWKSSRNIQILLVTSKKQKNWIWVIRYSLKGIGKQNIVNWHK